ncbi:hypothetical protein [Acetobacter sp.]|uniref:hypothetical protein n=1 Tax=Acetobacter sp. TaxID=440 RepID=UPI0039E87702
MSFWPKDGIKQPAEIHTGMHHMITVVEPAFLKAEKGSALMLTGEIPSMDQIESDPLRKIIFLLAIV